MTRRFGHFETHLLRDGVFSAPADVLTHVDGEASRRQAIERLGKPEIQIDVNCFLLRSADGITLIDTGAGTIWGPTFGQSRLAMSELGIEPALVDRVLLTHLHADHALGLFDGDAAFFPNAEIWVPDVDLAYFTDASALEATPEAGRSPFAIASQLRQLYGNRIRAIGAGPVLDGIEAWSLPGHTPGHTGYLLHDPVRSLMTWADTLHLAEIQPGDPATGLAFDLDPATAARTRLSLLEQAADAGWVVAGSHITGFNRVERAGNAFRIVPDENPA
ncbi:MBL fold metallo-hydrolase [Lichenicola cladoniae]|uniref:MBL fold metallo-hydrolase n=1 Tax=Lichenicola cladoniae TaxID=1484109 RepID=A0A6M8HUF8_9PROT|nr:MBL fold metallo-hydrolase [Lichenicola cladoniae]NPD66077.1 MBL fold metallo-hydrolase [Acetobacteraceae bacterium]QKE91950.1 MBL fold metallo-hydrolase [Lichenicola cladoniae]